MTRFGSLGITAFVIAAMAIISLQEAMVKLLTDDVSIWQLHILRSILVVGFAVIAARFVSALALKRLERPFWALARALLLSSAFFLLYSGLSFLSLAQSGAVFFTGPLIITLFAALFLGEKIGPRRIAALILGFSGVLVTAQPWRDGLDPAILFPLGAAICYAFGVMVTRGKCSQESAISLQVVHHSVFGILSLAGFVFVAALPIGVEAREANPYLLGGWSAFGLIVGLLIIGNAVANLVGALMLTHAYQTNESSGIAPLEYSYLAFAPLLDMAIWGDAPELSTLIGIALVAGSGVFIAIRSAPPPEPVISRNAEG